jgi:hypothetical protein
MDEDEYEEWLYQIDLIEQKQLAKEFGEPDLLEQLRDENGFRVPGCYRVLPAPTE